MPRAEVLMAEVEDWFARSTLPEYTDKAAAEAALVAVREVLYGRLG